VVKKTKYPLAVLVEAVRVEQTLEEFFLPLELQTQEAAVAAVAVQREIQVMLAQTAAVVS
jgi:hypothetical protein